MATLDLSLVSPVLQILATEAFDEGDAVGLLCKMDNMNGLAFVYDNLHALKARGIYEECLVQAFISCRVNNRDWDQDVLALMFGRGDRDKLRAAGAPLPGTGPFTLYRGVAGRGRARRLRGMSWTASLPVACWFANRNGLESPAVVSTDVPATEVLCYVDDRHEEEFIIMPPAEVRHVRLSPEEIAAHAASRNTIGQLAS